MAPEHSLSGDTPFGNRAFMETLSTLPAVDASVLEALRELQEEGEPDLIGELVELFLEDTPQRLSRLREALDQDRAADLARGAHALKGSAGNLGARLMQALCGRLEEMGRAGRLTGAAELLALLESEYTRTSAVLVAEVRRAA